MTFMVVIVTLMVMAFVVMFVTMPFVIVGVFFSRMVVSFVVVTFMVMTRMTATRAKEKHPHDSHKENFLHDVYVIFLLLFRFRNQIKTQSHRDTEKQSFIKLCDFVSLCSIFKQREAHEAL